jgi:hypothetical protein
MGVDAAACLRRHDVGQGGRWRILGSGGALAAECISKKKDRIDLICWGVCGRLKACLFSVRRTKRCNEDFGYQVLWGQS